jgi:hypothetical protein
MYKTRKATRKLSRKATRKQRGGSTMEPATRHNLKPGVSVYYQLDNTRGNRSNENIIYIGEIKDDGIIKYKGKIKVLNTDRGKFIIIDKTDKGDEEPISFFITDKNTIESGRFTGTLYIDDMPRRSQRREPQPDD